MRSFVILLVAALALGEDPASRDNASDEPLRVVASFGPLTDFARRIGGADVVVDCPVPEGEDPAFWLPSPEDVLALHAADLILLNGAGFERWTRVTSLPLSRVVDTTRPWRHELLRHESASSHRHGPAGEHEHGGINPHTWLDPEWAKRQAQVVRDAFARARPARKAGFDTRCEGLMAELDELHVAWSGLGRLADGEVFVASHPSYDYLGARYGWEVVNIAIGPDHVLSEDKLQTLATSLKAGLETGPIRRIARTVLFESEPDAELARILRERFGLDAIVVPPCEAASEAPFVTRMRANVDKLAPAFGKH